MVTVTTAIMITISVTITINVTINITIGIANIIFMQISVFSMSKYQKIIILIWIFSNSMTLGNMILFIINYMVSFIVIHPKKNFQEIKKIFFFMLHYQPSSNHKTTFQPHFNHKPKFQP